MSLKLLVGQNWQNYDMADKNKKLILSNAIQICCKLSFFALW